VAWTAVAIAIGVILAPTLLGDGALFYRDHATIFRRLFHSVLDARGQGLWPTWDPAAAGGEPLAAHPNAMAWSPLSWALALPGSFSTRYALFVGLHTPVAVLSAAFLARVMGANLIAAGLAGLLYGVGGPLLSTRPLIPALASMALGPAAIGLSVSVWRDPTALRVAAMALALAWHAKSSDPVYLILDVVLFAVAVGPDLTKNAPGRRAVALLVGGALGVAISAVQTLPLLALIQSTPRGAGFEYDKLATFSLHPARLFELFSPGWSGDVIGRETRFCSEPDGRLYLASIYAGATVLPLWLFAIVVPRARAFIVVAALALLLAMGRYTPLHELLVELGPGVSSSRYPIKLIYGAAIALAIAAAIALDALIKDPGRWRRPVAFFVVPATVAALGAVFAVAFAGDRLEPYLADGAAIEVAIEQMTGAASAAAIFGAFGVFALGFIVARPDIKTRAPTVATLIVVVAALDLALAPGPWTATIPRGAFDTPPVLQAVLADDPDPAVVLYEFFRMPPVKGRVTARHEALYGLRRGAPGSGVAAGVRYVLDPDLNSTRPPHWRSIAEAFRTLPEPKRINLLRRLGVSHLLVEAAVREVPGLRFVAEAPTGLGPPITAFAIRGRRPMVSLATATREVADIDGALEVLTSSVALHIVTVEGDSTVPAEASPPSGTATIEDSAPGFWRIATVTDEPAMLVLAQTFDPHWRVTIDGGPRELLRVDGMLTAVVLPTGRSTVELRYEPASFRWGAGLTLAGLLACLALLGWGVVRRRGPRRGPT